jgi:hypothetical protein
LVALNERLKLVGHRIPSVARGLSVQGIDPVEAATRAIVEVKRVECLLSFDLTRAVLNFDAGDSPVGIDRAHDLREQRV